VTVAAAVTVPDRDYQGTGKPESGTAMTLQVNSESDSESAERDSEAGSFCYHDRSPGRLSHWPTLESAWQSPGGHYHAVLTDSDPTRRRSLSGRPGYPPSGKSRLPSHQVKFSEPGAIHNLNLKSRLGVTSESLSEHGHGPQDYHESES
jgi:hypothetical protein